MGQLPNAKDTVASDTTTSSAYEDVDGLTVQLTVNDTSDILLLACVQASGSVSALAGWRFVFDGTNFLDLERQVGSEPGNIMLTDLVSSKGAGTYTFKLQHKVDSGILTTANATIIAISLHNGSGVVPADSDYVASDTVGSAWEDIPGLSCSVTLSKTSHIWAILVWNGYMSAAGKIGACLINIDGTDYEINEREWGIANEYGCVAINTRTTTPLVAGAYTVKGRWKGTAGATLTGEDFKLIVIAAEADSGVGSIDITKDVVTSDTTTATAIEDIDGLSVSAVPEETAHILSVMTLMTDVSVNNTSAYTAISINAVDSDVMERGHSSKLVYGSVGQVARTASTLGAGSYTVKGRWYTDSGNTLTGEQIVLCSIVLAATTGDVVEQVNLLVQKVVPLSPTTKTGAKKTVNLLVASMVALAVTATGGAKTTVSLLDQNIVPYAVTTAIGASASVNLLAQNVVPNSVSVKTGAVVSVNLLVQDVVPYATIPRADNQVSVNLITQKIVPYTPTPKVNASAQVNLLDQNIVPYATTIKTGAIQQVNLLVQDVIPYAVTPRADNQVAVNLIVQKIVPNAITTKIGATKVVSLLDQNIVPLSPTVKTSAKIIVSRLIQNIVPLTATPVVSGGDVVKVVNLLEQKIVQLIATHGRYVTDELVAYWKFDKNSGLYAYDTKGNNTGELKGGVAWDSDGKINSCCLYDGIDSYIEVQDDTSLDITGDASFEFWLYPHSAMLSGVHRFLSKREGSDIAYEAFAWNGKYALSISATSYKQLPLDIEADKWAHIIITQGPSDNNYAKIYRNSKYIGQTDMTQSITPNNTKLSFGCIIGIGQWWRGKQDEIRLYKKILSQAEVTRNYNITDSIMSTNLLTQEIIALHATGRPPIPPGAPFTIINPAKELIQVKSRRKKYFYVQISTKEYIRVEIDTHEEV